MSTRESLSSLLGVHEHLLASSEKFKLVCLKRENKDIRTEVTCRTRCERPTRTSPKHWKNQNRLAELCVLNSGSVSGSHPRPTSRWTHESSEAEPFLLINVTAAEHKPDPPWTNQNQNPLCSCLVGLVRTLWEPVWRPKAPICSHVAPPCWTVSSCWWKESNPGWSPERGFSLKGHWVDALPQPPRWFYGVFLGICCCSL